MRSEAGPLRLDEHQRQRVKEVTIARYQAAAKPFADWLVSEHLDPRSADEWDDLIVEYKYVRSLTSRPLTKSDFECTIASVEFFFPRFRSQLAWPRSVSRGWHIAYVPKHTMPVGGGLATLFAGHFAIMGHPRAGAGLLLQRACGLRPSEMLSLKQRDVLV